MKKHISLLLVVLLPLLAISSLSIQPSTFAQITSIPVGSGPVEVAVNRNTNKIYVTNFFDNTVSVIDGSADAVITTIGVGSLPRGADVNPVTNKVYTTNERSSTVSVIDGAADTVTATIPVGSGPVGASVNSNTNRVYVTNQFENTVSVIDGGTNTVFATIGVGSFPVGVGVNLGTNKVYVTNRDSATVSVIDGITNTVIATTAVGSLPLGVGVNPATNKIYVTNSGSNTVSIIDGATDTVSITVGVGTQPRGAGVNPVTNRIYVVNETPNTVSVIDGATDTAIDTVGVGLGPIGVGVNPVTNKVYVANHGAGTVSVIAPHVIDSDGDGVQDDADECPSVAGKAEYDGCPVADKQTLFEHTIDRRNGGSFKTPVADAPVKVFDRNGLNGVTLTTGEILSKNPDRSLYGKIFDDPNSQSTVVGRCTTGQDGSCLAGEAAIGDYLVLVRKEVQTTSGVMTVTVGLPKSPEDFVDTDRDGRGDLATKEFQYIKVINKDGSITFMSAQKAVITGSLLEIVYPQFVVWDGTQFLYPFIFTSDSAWTVDICASVPAGYIIVSDPCVQVFVSGETKIVFFDVVKTGSPEPMLNIRLTTSHLGKTTILELAIPGTATHQAIASPIPMPTILLTLLALLTVVLTRPVTRLLAYLKSQSAFARI